MPALDKPSEELKETFKRVLREIARVFVFAWRGVKEADERS